ncbi:Calx-beta domain-containing protein [Microvirga sp. GCM10011540]|uniref:Calx-beta domain-containing protein n=1 Tax=Microvirga sp. GCM10011540 TaxID=3317338 RepID=UPI003614E4DE
MPDPTRNQRKQRDLQTRGSHPHQTQKNLLIAAGFDHIYDSSNTPTTGGPVAAGLDADTTGAAPGATILLDRDQNFTLDQDETTTIRKVRVTLAQSQPGDLLGIQTSDEILLGPDGLQKGSTIQIGVTEGILTAVENGRIEVTFLGGGSAASVQDLVRALTYTRPEGDTFAGRQIQVDVVDDFDRTATSTLTVVDSVPRDVRMGTGVTEITVDEGPVFEIALSATDEDTPAANLTYEFAEFGDAGGKFKIEGNQLKLAPNQSLNHEDQVGGQGGYKVYVKAFDGTTYSAVQELTIKAADVNEAPLFVTFGQPQRTIRAGVTGAGVDVVQASWEDPDMADGFRKNKFAFLLADNTLSTTNGGFSINAETGQITTNDAIGTEQAGTKQLMVVACDETDDTLRAQSPQNIEIMAQDAPPVVQFATNSVTVSQTEGTGEGTTAYTFTVIRDVANDSTSKVKWTLDHGTTDAEDFSGPTSGIVEFTGDSTEATVTVLVKKDAADDLDEATFTILLSELDDGTGNAVVGNTGHTATGKIQDDDDAPPVNNAPSGVSLSSATAAEYAAAGSLVCTLSAVDEAPGALTYQLLDNAGGRFTLANGNQILVENGFKLDFEQAPSHTIKVRVSDGTHIVDQDLVINVTDMNPEITAGTPGNDVFFGGARNDRLSGGGGHDTIGGGAGKDKLYGGKGKTSKDAFVFDTKLTSKSVANRNKDKIYDFGSKYDSLFFDDAAFTNKTIAKYLKKKNASLDKPAKLKASYFKKGSKATDKDDFFILKGKKLYWDVDGSGRKAMVEIASFKLQKKEGETLTHKDFFFI